MADLGSETVVRQERPAGDGGGVFNDGSEPAAAVTYAGCAVYPRGTPQEASDRALTTVAGYTLLIPSSYPDVLTEVQPEDVVVWRGMKLEVEGDTGLWPFLDGELACYQVNLKRYRG